VEIKPCVTYTMATSLDVMTENMMLARQMFFSRFTKEGTEIVKPILREELQKVRTFESFEGGVGRVRIEMKAWIGTGKKMGDKHGVPV
jgi:hypothetical protein